MVSEQGDLQDRQYSTAVHEVDKLNELTCSLDQGSGSTAVGFDLKAGYIYAQRLDHELMVFTFRGVKKKEYSFGLPRSSVLQYLVEPNGNRLVMLTSRGTYFVEVP